MNKDELIEKINKIISALKNLPDEYGEEQYLIDEAIDKLGTVAWRIEKLSY